MLQPVLKHAADEQGNRRTELNSLNDTCISCVP